MKKPISEGARRLGDAALVLGVCAALGLPWLDNLRVAYEKLTPEAHAVRDQELQIPLGERCLTIRWLAGGSKQVTHITPRNALELLKYTYARARRVKKALMSSFGGKTALLHVGAAIRYRLLHKSPIHTVLTGKDGWLFYFNDEIRAFYLSELHLDREHVEKWRRYFVEESEVAKAVGARYIAIMCPNKASVYSEFLPEGVRLRPGRTLTDVIGRAVSQAGIEWIDLRPALMAAKPIGRLYHRTDTHWNELGALIAARVILDALRQDYAINVPSVAELRLSRRYSHAGDLARMMGLRNQLMEEQIMIQDDSLWSDRMKEMSGEQRQFGGMRRGFVATDPAGKIPRVVVLRDSFSTALFPCLVGGFRESYWLWEPTLDRRLIERVRPQLILRIFVERRLANRATNVSAH